MSTENSNPYNCEEQFTALRSRDIRRSSRPTPLYLRQYRLERIRWFIVRNLRKLGLEVQW
jgi:hypothetical protein